VPSGSITEPMGAAGIATLPPETRDDGRLGRGLGVGKEGVDGPADGAGVALPARGVGAGLGEGDGAGRPPAGWSKPGGSSDSWLTTGKVSNAATATPPSHQADRFDPSAKAHPSCNRHALVAHQHLAPLAAVRAIGQWGMR